MLLDQSMITASQYHLADFDALAERQQSPPDPFWLLLGKKGGIS
jgi:hypothetical protein